MYENVRVDRLERLEKLLLADAENKTGIRFDLNFLGVTRLDEGEAELDCGTSGCAMGLAAMSGEFKAEGLDYVRDYAEGRHIVICLDGAKRTYEYAAVEFFGIPMTWAYHLFSPGSYPVELRQGGDAERAVAAKIREKITYALEERRETKS